MSREMIAAALDTGVSCAWVLADALYGSDYQLRRMLEDRGQPYVLAVRSNQHLRFLTQEGLVQTDPAYLADEMEADDRSEEHTSELQSLMRITYAVFCLK